MTKVINRSHYYNLNSFYFQFYKTSQLNKNV